MKNMPFANYPHHFPSGSDALLLMTAWLGGFLQVLIFPHADRFEPCGLAQQYAIRYGSAARKTGGLATPSHTSPVEGNTAMDFFAECISKGTLHTIQQALEVLPITVNLPA